MAALNLSGLNLLGSNFDVGSVIANVAGHQSLAGGIDALAAGVAQAAVINLAVKQLQGILGTAPTLPGGLTPIAQAGLNAAAPGTTVTAAPIHTPMDVGPKGLITSAQAAAMNAAGVPISGYTISS